MVVAGFLTGLAPAGGLSPVSAQGANNAQAADDSDPRGGWRPASEGGEREDLKGPRKLDNGLPRHDPPRTPQKAPPEKRVRELPERRSASSKVFQLEDGRLQQELSSLPLHYRDGQGRWQPIDTTVRPSSRPGFAFGNETNGFRAFFGDDPASLVRFETASGAVSLTTPGGRPGRPTTKDNTVTYANGLGAGKDLSYEVTPEELKESIVLKSRPGGNGDVTVTFGLGLDGFEAHQREDGSIAFERLGGDGEAVLIMPAPFMTDAADDPSSPYGKAWSSKVTQTLSDDGTSVTVTADGEWLRAQEREFPVIIDPTIKIVPTPTTSQDVMVMEESPANNQSATWRLSVGTTDQGAVRSLLKFPLDIPQGTKIDSAQLQLWYDQFFVPADKDVTVEAHRATGSWTETGATWNNTVGLVGELGASTFQSDDGDFLVTSPSGSWPYSTNSAQIPHGTNGDFAYNSGATTGDKYTWFPCLPESGTYRVETHYVTASDRATAAPYKVGFKGGTQNYPVNQSAATVGGKWTSLGSHPFDAGCWTGSVELSDVANKTVVADSARWIKDATAVKPANDNGGHWHSFSVRDVVQGWADQPNQNYGFVLKTPNEGVLNQGGPRYEASRYSYNSEGANRPRLVVTYGRAGVGLNLPTTFHATGAELSWPAYVDPCPDPNCWQDDLVEYQVHRSVNQTFTPSASTLVAPLAAGTTAHTDTTAEPTPSGDDPDLVGNAYYYMVAVKTKDGTVVPGPTRLARLPTAGRVKKIVYADYDTTLASAEPTTGHDTMFGEPWLYAGNNNAHGVTRSLVKFPALAGIPAGAKVIDAEVRLWNREMQGDGTAQWELRGLTRDFNEAQATWARANSTTTWTTAGGDVGATAYADDATEYTNDPKRRRFKTVAPLVQGWVTTPSSNKGALVKLVNEGAAPAPQARAIFLSSEGEEPELRPELWVTYLEQTPESTYYAPATPDVVETKSTTTVAVTLTNTTPSMTWDSQWKLSYRWTRPDGTAVTAAQLVTNLPATMGPGTTVTVNADVKAPDSVADSNHRSDHILNWDLYNPSTNTWLSSMGGVNSVGALKQSMAVEESTSDQVGLESFYAYAGKNTGAGGTVVNNLHAGNAVWSYDAFANPSRGLSTFVRLAYNSKDVSDSVAGFGWSLQTSSVMRLGSPLDPHPNSQARAVSLTDGDGTTHVWNYDDKGTSTTTDDEYVHPAGVHLYLQKLVTCQPNNTKDPESRAWVMTKPDRTQFFFDCAGYVSSVVDKNGNVMTFVYEERKSNNKPTKFLRYIEDATGRRTLTIDYYAKGQTYDYINDTTWTRQSATNLTNPFIIDKVHRITDISGRKLSLTYTDKGLLGEMVDGEGSTQPKVFKFAYDMTQGNKNVKLVKVTDPKSRATNLSYYSNPEDDPKFKWSLKTITDRLTYPTTFTYTDPDGTSGQNIETRVTDAENHTTTFLTDDKGRPTQSTNAKAQVMKLTWDADNNVEKLEEANNAITTWSYDPKTGYPLVIKDAEAYANGWPGTQLRYQVGLGGNTADLIEKQSSENRLWKFGYTDEGDLEWVTDPKGTSTPAADDYTTSYTYDTWGQLLTATDANGNVTGNSDFHPTGFPQKITDALDKATTFAYDVRGQVLEVTDAYGKKVTQTYDLYGRPLESRAPKRQDQNELIVTPAPVYDANDNVTKATAPELWVNGARVGDAGAISEAFYDHADQLSYTLSAKNDAIDPERRTSFTYDKVGNLRTTTEPKGNLTPAAGDFTTTNTHDEIYQITDVVNADGDKLSYRYDNVGNVTHVIDPRKNLTSDPNDYTSWIWSDRNHRPVVALDAINAYEVTTYDRDGLVTRHQDKAQNETFITLDARGQAVEVKAPHDKTGTTVNYRTTQFEYDQVGNRTKVITPRGVNTATAGDFVRESVYDELNRVKEQRTPFDPADPDYNAADKTTFTYDDVGRLSKVSAPPSATQTMRNDTVYTYFDNGWAATAKDPWDITTSYDYNPLGQQTRNVLTPGGAAPTDPQSPNRTMTWDYFGSGALRSRSDDGGPVGRSVVLTDNSDSTAVTATGTWPRTSTGANFHGYDYATHDAGTGTDAFTWYLDVPQDGNYDVYVRYPAVTGAATNASFKVTYKDNAEVTKTVNQTTNAGTWVSLGKYAFAQGGSAKVALTQNAGGKVVADAVKLVRDNTGQTDNESRDFVYKYDPNGNLTKITDNSPATPVDTYNVAYTGLNQVETVQEFKAAQPLDTSTFTYDPNGTVETTTHPKSYSAFEYDARNLLSKVTNGVSPTDPAPKVTTYTYTPKAERLKETKGNANTVDYTYFFDGRLKTQVEKKPNGTLVSEHTITYEPNGNRATDVSKKMNADNNTAYLDTTTTYTYDPRDRIARVERTGAGAGVETYKHDANDNVISQDNGATTFTYNRNRLMSRQVGPYTFGFNYDPFGRLQSTQVFGIEQERYAYDGFDRTLSHKASGKTTAYSYDPLDRTATKTTDAGTASAKTTEFNYLGLTGEVLEEEVVGVGVTKSYQYSPWGERLSQVTHKTGGVKEDAYYGYNPHSDVETITDTSGNAKATYGYTAYGNNNPAEFTGIDKPDAQNPTKEPYNPYRFNAKRWDQNSSSYDMGFRDYSPGLNRFLTRDMYNGALADMNLGLNPYTSNRYAFTSGNPINRIENDGHDNCGNNPYFNLGSIGCIDDMIGDLVSGAPGEAADAGDAAVDHVVETVKSIPALLSACEDAPTIGTQTVGCNGGTVVADGIRENGFKSLIPCHEEFSDAGRTLGCGLSEATLWFLFKGLGKAAAGDKLTAEAAMQTAKSRTEALRAVMKSPAKGRPTYTGAAVSRKTGQVWEGTSGVLDGRPGVLDDVLPEKSLTAWSEFNCAEVTVCAMALEDGAKLADLEIYIVKTSTGAAATACANCSTWVPIAGGGKIQ